MSKRFTVDKVGIYDNQEKKQFKFIAYEWMECDIYDCCELLNELSDENNILNKNEDDLEECTIENIKLKELNDDKGKRIISLIRTNKTLKEENEQLRKQCFELEKDYVIETSDISDKIYLDDEIEELKQKYGVADE